jgi:putative oxidoreductase
MQVIFTGFDLPFVAITLLRVTMGVFFTISGYHKLFNKARHATVTSTMIDDHVPDPRLASWFIPMGEFFGGLGLFVGFLTPLAAIGLFFICCGALIADGLKRIANFKPIDRADYVDDVLYLPEALYGIILLTIALIGSGPYSVDALVLSHFPH